MEIVIDGNERSAWHRVISNFIERCDYQPEYDRLLDFVVAELTFPKSIEASILEFTQPTCGQGSLLIRGAFEVSTLAPTPEDSRRPDKIVQYLSSEVVVAALAAKLGTIFCYEEQSAGELSHQICPVPGREHGDTGESSLKTLTFQSDGATLPFRPAISYSPAYEAQMPVAKRL